MTNELATLAAGRLVSPLLVPSTILLLPIAVTFGFRWAVLRDGEGGHGIIWAAYRGFGRFIMAITVACWWLIWDLRGPSELAPMLVRTWPGTLDASSAQAFLFGMPPFLSLGTFLILCYTVDRALLKLRWTFIHLVRRAWWRLLSFVIPLLMVAAGFDNIFERRVAASIGWHLSAGVVSKIGTGFLRSAEGMKFNKLKSGELRNRALRMASRMGITLGRVYMVPAGKGHLTNAYSMSNAIGLTDNLGRYLTKAQVDYVIAHELAHVKLKHGRKHFLLVIAVFSIMTLLLFRLSPHALLFRPLLQLAVILGPLLAIYYSSRRFEHSADGEAVKFTGDPETAIRALVNLHHVHEVPFRCDRFTELFMTHPAPARRIEAIANLGQIRAERLSDILKDEKVPKAAAQRG